MKDTFAIIYAKHGNPLLGDLIAHRCVSALPLGGRFRAIDVILSNISHSGIRDVGVITQRNYQSLVEHIGAGGAWDLDNKRGGVACLSPYDQGMATDLYQGFGDALFAKRYFINRQRAQYCLLLSGDMVYRADYNLLLERHLEMDADITILCSRNARIETNDPSHSAHIITDEDGIITDVDYDSDEQAGALLNMGACLMKKDLLVRLVEDACAAGRYDFVTDILEPALPTLRSTVVEHTGYAGQLATVKAYFDITRDMLDSKVRDELFFANGPVYTRIMDAPPVRYSKGCEVEDSVFGNGCNVCGKVKRSVVFRGVSIESGADVQDCIIMQDSHIGHDVHLRNVIIDKNVVVSDGTRLVGTPDAITVVRKGSILEDA